MTQLFGEFLIEKKILDQQTLVQLLIEQCKGLPSSVEIIYNLKLMTASQIISVMRHQILNRIEFIEASKNLGLWKPEFDRAIQSEIGRVKISFPQLLLSKLNMNSKQLIEAVDEYVNSQDNPTHPANESRILYNLCDTISSFQTLDYLDQLEFSRVFNEAKMDRFRSLAANASSDNLAQIKLLIPSLKGLACLVKAELLEKLLKRLENGLNQAETLLSIDPLQNLENLRGCISSLVQSIEQVRSSLIQTCSEERYVQSLKHRSSQMDIPALPPGGSA